VFLTNNSAATPAQYVERLAGHGIEVGLDRIITSGQAIGRYLDQHRGSRWKKAVVIGEQGLADILRSRGIDVLGHGDHEGADLVVVGWDRHFDYDKLRAAVVALRNGAAYIASNTDSTYPTPSGPWPGAGTMVAAVSTGGGRKPFVAGKPNPFIVQMALERLGTSAGEALLIGDRLDSDIKAGIDAGVDTLLVLTGISRRGDIDSQRTPPTHVREDLLGLFE
jgi:4-nitrophenyl phosphatase